MSKEVCQHLTALTELSRSSLRSPLVRQRLSDTRRGQKWRGEKKASAVPLPFPGVCLSVLQVNLFPCGPVCCQRASCLLSTPASLPPPPAGFLPLSSPPPPLPSSLPVSSPAERGTKRWYSDGRSTRVVAGCHIKDDLLWLDLRWSHRLLLLFLPLHFHPPVVGCRGRGNSVPCAEIPEL